MSQFFASGGQSIGVSASASVLPMNIQDLFSMCHPLLNAIVLGMELQRSLPLETQSSGKHKTWLFSSLPLSPQSLLSFLLLFLLKHPPYPSQSKSWAFYCVTLKEDGP